MVLYGRLFSTSFELLQFFNLDAMHTTHLKYHQAANVFMAPIISGQCSRSLSFLQKKKEEKIDNDKFITKSH